MLWIFFLLTVLCSIWANQDPTFLNGNGLCVTPALALALAGLGLVSVWGTQSNCWSWELRMYVKKDRPGTSTFQISYLANFKVVKPWKCWCGHGWLLWRVWTVKHHATFHTLENNIQTLNFFPVPLPRTPILCGNKKNSRHLKRTERDTLESILEYKSKISFLKNEKSF